MGKKNIPRFTRRVHKDIDGIKARFQKGQNLLRNNNGGKRFNLLYKKQEIPDLSLLRLIIFMTITRHI